MLKVPETISFKPEVAKKLGSANAGLLCGFIEHALIGTSGAVTKHVEGQTWVRLPANELSKALGISTPTITRCTRAAVLAKVLKTNQLSLADGDGSNWFALGGLF